MDEFLLSSLAAVEMMDNKSKMKSSRGSALSIFYWLLEQGLSGTNITILLIIGCKCFNNYILTIWCKVGVQRQQLKKRLTRLRHKLSGKRWKEWRRIMTRQI